jgi:LPPG:FO 2-phospho-L-lactate transferase
VRRHCAPAVHEIVFAGAATARAYPDFLAALDDGNLRMVVICPSNPLISIDPILSLPGVRDALRACRAPVVAVSPIIGGKAVKGPTGKMMAELGLPVDAASVARHYGGLLDHYVIDEADADAVTGLDVPVTATRTLMENIADREALARVVLAAGRGF